MELRQEDQAVAGQQGSLGRSLHEILAERRHFEPRTMPQHPRPKLTKFGVALCLTPAVSLLFLAGSYSVSGELPACATSISQIDQLGLPTSNDDIRKMIGSRDDHADRLSARFDSIRDTTKFANAERDMSSSSGLVRLQAAREIESLIFSSPETVLHPDDDYRKDGDSEPFDELCRVAVIEANAGSFKAAFRDLDAATHFEHRVTLSPGVMQLSFNWDRDLRSAIEAVAQSPKAGTADIRQARDFAKTLDFQPDPYYALLSGYLSDKRAYLSERPGPPLSTFDNLSSWIGGHSDRIEHRHTEEATFVAWRTCLAALPPGHPSPADVERAGKAAAKQSVDEGYAAAGSALSLWLASPLYLWKQETVERRALVSRLDAMLATKQAKSTP